jgi:hypothetical protein
MGWVVFTKLRPIYSREWCGRLCLKCDGTRAEDWFRHSPKRTITFTSAGKSVQSTTGSRGVRIGGSNGSNAGYTMFRGSVKSTGYPLHLPVSPSLTTPRRPPPYPCVTVCHLISTALYRLYRRVARSHGRCGDFGKSRPHRDSIPGLLSL